MKRILCFVLAIMGIVGNIFAYDFSAVSPSGQTLYYTVSGNNATVTYPGSSSYYQGYSKPTGTLVIPSSVVYNGIAYVVTSIGEHAFIGCSGLTSVTIPNSVTSLGEAAFHGCSGLTSVTISNSIVSIGSSVFKNCTSLTSVTIPDGVTSIDYSAFYGCSGLTSVTIPNSVTSIGIMTFYGCTGLTSITIPNGVTSIGSFSFNNCSSLTTITIPNSIIWIGGYAFNGCSGLTSVTIPNSVTSLGEAAFHGCSDLTLMYMKPSMPPTLGNASSICDNIIDLVVPRNSYFAYTNADTNYTRHNIFIDSAFVTILVNDTSRGYVIGYDSVYTYPSLPDTITLTAIPYYGYHFTRWNDNSTNSSRQITSITEDITLTAYFDPNQYSIALAVDTFIHGTVSGAGNYNYLSTRTITAMPNYGYHFTQWSDGDTNNPRTLTLIQDTAFTALFAKNTYNIAALSADTAKGYAGGTGTLEYLDTVTLTATANYGYHFTMWSDGNAANPRTVQVTRDSIFTAQFDYNQYSIALVVDTTIHGTVSGAGNYNYLSARTISATPNYGYHFTMWNDGDTNNPRTLTLTQDTAFTALFAKNSYNIAALSADTVMGAVAGTSTLEYLDSATMTATANYGYHFTMWSDGNIDNPRHVQVTRDSVFTAQFDYNQYSITLAVDTTIHGTVSGAGNYNYLSARTINATANYGYHFTAWNDGDTNNPRTITLTQDTTFTALFAKNQYTVTTISNDTVRGVVLGGATVNYLDAITLVAVSNYGYHLNYWRYLNDNGNYVTVNAVDTLQLTVTRNMSVTAYFTYNQYSIALAVDTAIHGSVSGAGSYNYLSTHTITATPNYGYHFTQWSDGDTNNPRTLTLTQDTSFTALFERNNYNLTVDVNDATLGVVTLPLGTSALYQDTLKVVAAPIPHHHVASWQGQGVVANSADRDTVWVSMDDNRALICDFAIDTHIVSATANDIARGMVQSNGTEYVYGTPCTVTATAYTGYTFHHWSNGVTANPYTFAVLEDVELTAIFLAPDEMTYTVTVSVNNSTMGSATVNGAASDTVMSGTMVTLEAIPNTDYHFVRWSDDNTEAVRTVIVAEDMSFTAYFESNEGISDITSVAIKVWNVDGRIYMTRDGQPVDDFRVYDVMGREVFRATHTNATPVLPNGVYLVKVTGLPARRVVVIR